MVATNFKWTHNIDGVNNKKYYGVYYVYIIYLYKKWEKLINIFLKYCILINL